jgi:osmotically-inducible protein OsmY
MWPFGKSIKQRVEEEMKKSPLVASQPVTVEESHGVVKFQGVVSNAVIVGLLNSIASGINGVKSVDTSMVGVEDNEPDTVPPVDEAEVQAAIDASSIAKSVYHDIINNGELSNNPIDVLQSGTEVVLRGAVDSEHEYRLAVQVASAVAGVTGVNANDLQIVEGAKQKHEAAVAEEVAKVSAPGYVNNPDEWYVVRRGDTLTAIAAKYSSDIDTIAKANGIHDVNMIKIGQKIQIPR